MQVHVCMGTLRRQREDYYTAVRSLQHKVYYCCVGVGAVLIEQCFPEVSNICFQEKQENLLETFGFFHTSDSSYFNTKYSILAVIVFGCCLLIGIGQLNDLNCPGN